MNDFGGVEVRGRGVIIAEALFLHSVIEQAGLRTKTHPQGQSDPKIMDCWNLALCLLEKEFKLWNLTMADLDHVKGHLEDILSALMERVTIPRYCPTPPFCKTLKGP